MAHRQATPRAKARFQNVQLLKSETLGTGAYGSVYKAKCDDLLCAAKVIHTWLLQPVQAELHREHRLVQSRFSLECELLREITHPNIIQYLGLHNDPQTGGIVLLMELMDTSLRGFLDNKANKISYYVQISIAADVAIALSFLHSNNILHRDLSSNNILLHGQHRAKLSDFGMAKVAVECQRQAISNTMCPGTEVYMPPEAVDVRPRYTEKGDTFSLGVNIIQILTRKFPAPGERMKNVPTTDPRFPTAKCDVPERQRRHNHISEINPDDPLLAIALDCLKDKDNERPTAHVICDKLSQLKAMQEQTSDKHRHEREILKMQDTIDILRYENTDLRKDLRELRRNEATRKTQQDGETQQTQQTITARQLEIQRLREELSTAQSRIHEQQELISVKANAQRALEEGILDLHTLNQEQHCTLRYYKSIQPQVKSNTIKLKWMPAAKAPCKMTRETDPVVGGSMVYIRPGESKQIYAFNSISDTWQRLPDSPVEQTTLAIVNGSPVLVGGSFIDMLLRLRSKGKDKKFTKDFSPMPTKRSNSIALCLGSQLIVAGGQLDGRREKLTIIEVMDTETLKWSQVGNLPEALSASSATICGERVYISNGNSKVLTCSLHNLTRPQADTHQPSQSWSTIADMPTRESTLVTYKSRLLSVGGCDTERRPTAAVCMYRPKENDWIVIGTMTTARVSCFATALPDDRLLVVGGVTCQWGRASDSVEFGFVDYGL